VKPENLFSTIFYPTPKKVGRAKTSNFTDLPSSCRQSEVHNFETAQDINEQKIYLSSTINVLKMIPNLGASTHGVLLHPREKIDIQTINDMQKCVFCPIPQNFLLLNPTSSMQCFGHSGHHL